MCALWSQFHEGSVINLGKGHPRPDLFPTTEVSAAYQLALQPPPNGRGGALLQYGRMQGNLEFCVELCQWLRKKAGRRKVSEDEIIATTGSGPGLAICCQLFSKPGDTIFIDSPAYFLTFYTFRDCGLKVVEIPTDEDGMNIDVVEEKLKSDVRPTLLYTVPICNNPTGVTLSIARRQRLVELSREYGFKIMADEVYQMLAWDSGDNPVPSCFDLDDPNNPTVFAISSFSKLLGPGIRVGWIETNKKHIERILDCGTLQSGGGANPLASGMVTELLRSGFVDRHITRLRSEYEICCDAMCTGLEVHVKGALRPGETLKYHTPRGGFFCFVTLPSRINTSKMLKEAQSLHGVTYFAGLHFCNGGTQFDSSLRLCFAFLKKADIEKGMTRLAKAIAQYED